MKKLAISGVAALLLLSVGGWIALRSGATAAGFLPYRDPDAVAAGQAIYDDHCAACHGAELEGQVPNWRERNSDGRLPAPPHDESGHTWHHTDEQLFLITKYGSEKMIGGGYESDMIGFEDILSDDDILAVLGYIKSTWNDEIVGFHNQRNAAASN